jgi:pSer/pThr/pTyr-binding forkhead associated (FHA) protein
MQVVLVMFKADGEKRSFSLPKAVTLIGRREDCDLRIPLGEVSRKHCRLVKDGQSLRLEDLGSSNGTYLNGQRVQESGVNPGDSIQVGAVSFIVQIDGVPADDAIQAPATRAVEPVGGQSAPGAHAPGQTTDEDIINFDAAPLAGNTQAGEGDIIDLDAADEAHGPPPPPPRG